TQEGLFEPSRKKQIPSAAQRVAIVTSPTGAAIRDMCNVLERRMKNLEIMVFPCSVQGKAAASEIVAAIELANKIGTFDVMIDGRGGGSIADLWSLNEEIVARAISASKITSVSAICHETDFRIADFVANLRHSKLYALEGLILRNASELSYKICMQL